MHIGLCFLLLLASFHSIQGANQGWQSNKSNFIDHIVNLVNNLVADNATTRSPSTTTTRPTRPTGSANIPVVAAGENPAAAINRMQNSVLAINLLQTIAPPAVRPCFIRPAFCPATSDACSKSRCARLYANGVRIGSRFYKRVKCRLNYCRETCGKAEWYADGRRLIGCSDSSSTLDSPAWSVARLFPKPARLDSRNVPVERVASTRTPGQIGGGIPFDQVQVVQQASQPVYGPSRTLGNNNPQRRSVNQYIGDLGEALANKTRDLSDSIKQRFDELNVKRVHSALLHAVNVSNANTRDFATNLTAYIDKQLDEAMANNGLAQNGVEHDAETESVKSTTNSGSSQKKQSSKTDLWLLMFLVGLFY